MALGSGSVRHAGRRLPLRSAAVWIYHNQPKRWDQVTGEPPHPLDFPEGIVVHPTESGYPRLPLLGLRAIMRNKLRLTVDGRTGLRPLGTRPWWWPFG